MSSPVTASSVVIRPMQSADIDAVYAIEQRIFPNPWSLTGYKFEMQNPVAHKWVAELERGGAREIVGMVIVWLLVDEAHIGNIAVEQPYRQRGIGCRLLKTALMSMSRRGAVRATLEVRESNQAAQMLYRRFGFTESGRRSAYYVDNREDALILTLVDLDVHEWQALDCQTE